MKSIIPVAGAFGLAARAEHTCVIVYAHACMCMFVCMDMQVHVCMYMSVCGYVLSKSEAVILLIPLILLLYVSMNKVSKQA